jgi:hypothetical protein
VRSWTGQPCVLQGLDPEPVSADQIVHLPVQMTAAGEARPEWIEPILPARNALLGRPSVLDEEQHASRP